MKEICNRKAPLCDVSTSLLMEHTRYISSMERESGSDGEWKAAHYFERTMREYGLEVEIKAIENLISLPKSANLTLDDGDEIECITQSYAVSTHKDGLRGSLVYYPEEKDINGKIVVLKGLASPTACFDLERKGAKALIFINGGDYPHNMAISPVWGMPVPETLGLLGKIPVISLNKDNGKRLLNKMKNNIIEGTIYAVVETDFLTVPLCVADLRAKNETEKYILFNGHLDSWHYGAFDNATANSVMLEIARILKGYQDELKTNIRFIWWSGHSNGRYSGSNWYADYNWEDIHRNAVVNINIDGLGAKGSTSYPEVASSAQCYRCGAQAINKLTGQNPEYNRIKRNGDQSFWGHGVPSLYQILSLQPEELQGRDTFVPGLPWFWHTTEDKFEYIDEDVITLDCKIYLEAIWNFVANDIFPFSYSDMGEEIIENLMHWQDIVGESFHLSESLEKAIILKDLFIKFDEYIDKIRNTVIDKDKVKRIRKLMMNLNRLIMPVHYCISGQFDVDLALPQEPFPGFTDLRVLSQLSKDTLEFKALERKMVRERNRVNFALNESIRMLGDLE